MPSIIMAMCYAIWQALWAQSLPRASQVHRDSRHCCDCCPHPHHPPHRPSPLLTVGEAPPLATAAPGQGTFQGQDPSTEEEIPFLVRGKPTARPATSKRGRRPALDGSYEGRLTSRQPVVCDGKGRPVRLHLSKGQCSDFTGAEVLLRDLPEASCCLETKDATATRSAPWCWSKASRPASRPDGTATRGSHPPSGLPYGNG